LPLDQAEIETSVAAGVARNHELLAKVPAGKYDQLVAKLKARIATAEKTLLDPKLRAQYKRKLRSHIAAKRGTRSSKANPELTAASGSAPATSQGGAGPSVREAEPLAPVRKSEPPVAPPHKGGGINGTTAGSAAPLSATPSSPAAPATNIPPAAPVATPASIPQAQSVPLKAVPLAMPVQNPQMAVPLAKAAVPIANAAPTMPPAQAEFLPPSDPLGSDGEPAFEKIVVQKVRKKRSKLVGPIALLLMLGAGAGGSFLIYQNFDELVNLGRNVTGETTNDDDADEKDKPAGKDSELMSRRVDADVEEPGVDVSVGNLAAETDERKGDSVGKASMKDGPSPIDAASKKSPVEQMVGEKVPNQAMLNETMVSDAGLVTMDQSQLARVRRDMDRAYRGLYRREAQVAKKSWQSANAVLGEVKQSGAVRFVPEQQAFADRVGDFEKLMSHVDGFWEQVRKSADSIPGGQEIIIVSQSVGFVEAKPQSIIIRRSGSNIEYQYLFCPPGLAVAIAEQGAVEDIPTWNIQKAAFYIVDQLGGLDHGRRINEFLEIAEEAGHDCGDLRRLGKFEFGSLGRPAEKAKLASKSEPVSAVELFREQHDYKSPRQLSRGNAYSLAELLFKSDSPDAEQRLGLLEEARLLAIQAGAASLAEDTIYELDLIGEIEAADLSCETFIRICSQRLQADQVRQLMERSIGCLNSSSAQSVKPKIRAKLKERLQKLAARFQMPDAARRLKQIEI